ncbi:MAG: PfkB family carbohydrate kinase [Candidatus Magasanikbacteria bacterium]
MKISALPDFGGIPVFVVGDTILDVWTHGEAYRPSPEDIGAQCYRVDRSESVPGGAGSTARVIRALGGVPTIFGVCGTGHGLHQLRQALDCYGLRAELAPDTSRPTTRKERFCEEGSQRQLLVVEHQSRREIDSPIEIQLLAKLNSQSKPAVLVVTDQDRGVVTSTIARGLSKYSRDQAIPLIVDGRERPIGWYVQNFPYLFLITPNVREAEVMMERALPNLDAVQHAGREMKELLGCNVLITMSEDGAYLFDTEGDCYRQPALNGRPLCVSGAGDTLVATIALCIAAGMSLRDACEVGQYATALNVAKEGTSSITWDELSAALLGEGLPH